MEEIQAKLQVMLDVIRKEEFQKCFKWQKHWDQCIVSKRNYFERTSTR